MLFQHTIEMVLNQTKSQTRRLVKPEHTLIGIGEHAAVVNAKGRTIYQVGQTLAVQPGRTAKGIARIRITGIKQEDVRSISDDDVKAEGFRDYKGFMLTWTQMRDPSAFAYLWKNEVWFGKKYFMQRPTDRYQAWVLEFELVTPAAAE